MFSGLKVAAAFSVIGAVFAEWVGASEGLGYLILVLNNQTATTDMFAVIVVLASIGIGLFLIVSLIERLMLPWYYESREVESEGLELEPEEIR
jgi:ABC-type nitrate/sulfonate/bicarbonate transport system permease component